MVKTRRGLRVEAGGGRASQRRYDLIVYPETEEEEEEVVESVRRAAKFRASSRRRPRARPRPVRVYFPPRGESGGGAGGPRQLRPLRPNNYVEHLHDESDAKRQELGASLRRSGRQRKLIHHSFNESWITDEIKVRGYPRLYERGRRITSSSSDDFSEEEEEEAPPPAPKPSPAVPNRETPGRSTRSRRRGPDESEVKEEEDVEEGEENEEPKQNGVEEPKTEEKSDDESEDKTLAATRRILRRATTTRRRIIKDDDDEDDHDDVGGGPANKKEDSSDSESSDTGSDIVVRRQPRRSTRPRKPRNDFMQSDSGNGKKRTIRRSQRYNMRKTYSLRERKQPKIIVRTQSPSSTSSSDTSDSEAELNVSMKNKTKNKQKSKAHGDQNDRALREIQPLQVDGSIRFSSVGGLEEHIRCLREMVLFPLMYPQLFERFGFHPPKGVLFHGPPGTGKTLLARALANECSIQGGQKVSFFLRKGADCLKKWVGESERNIKLLFQQATKMKPSIIFFDEIDALAPVRSARQDQVHTSVVGTLLAEMDGLCDRGEVIVIGATNRLDAVDPALRRAGRFDRELHFPHPPADQRASILRVLTSSWNPLPSDETIQYIANITTGYGGSDLKALCSESILKALERTYPQVYKSQHALLIEPQKVQVLCEDMMSAMKGLVAAGSRSVPPPARPMPTHLRPLLSSTVDSALSHIKRLFPMAEKASSEDVHVRDSKSFFHHNWSAIFMLRGPCSSTYIGPAVLTEMEHCAVRELSVSVLHQGVMLTPEQALLNLFSEVRRCSQSKNGCVLYAPSIDLLWPLLGDAGANLVLRLWQEVSASGSCLLFATHDGGYDALPDQVRSLFPAYKDCLHAVRNPSKADVQNLLRPLFLGRALEAPRIEVESQYPELPKAPPPPAPRPTAVELRRTARREAHVLRELRIFLRDVCRKLAANRRFYKFTKPVDLEEVTDYLTIIKQPMDLETMMTKVDLHRYNCAREFLEDIDLICANALEYNPDRTSSDKQIRHEACSLRDHAYSLVDVEMDTDFEEECRSIAAKRANAGIKTVEQELPSFIYTAANLTVNTTVVGEGETPNKTQAEASELNSVDLLGSANPSSCKRKRKKKSMWSKGMVTKKTKLAQKDGNPIITDEESKENKPMCASPVNGEPSMTDNDTGQSGEHDRVSPKTGELPSTTTVSAERSRMKMSSDREEMLFDANTIDEVIGVKYIECTSPVRNGTSSITSPLTSTPRRKKSSLEHSNKDCDSKLIVNKDELETALQKCVDSLKTVSLNHLVDSYDQLNRVMKKYSTLYDRSALPAEFVSTVTKFVDALKKKK